MAPAMSNCITIDRAYFETILRRADYNHDLSTVSLPGADDAIIAVLKEDYENLLLLARQFENLKRNLVGAGVTEENIATLVLDANGSLPQSTSYVPQTPPYSYNQTRGVDAYPKRPVYSKGGFQRTGYHAHGSATNSASGKASYSSGDFRPSILEEDDQGWGDQCHPADSLTPSHSADGPTDIHIDSFSQAPASQSAFLPRTCKRTIAICGLPGFATLADVTDQIRGGQLLDVYLRRADHIALVSFVRGEDASRFHEHATKKGIYIKNKKTFVKWADRQFILSKHVANKIIGGASRNMVIHQCGAQHTEDTVRDDLEHIHNLTVIKVEFVGGSCYIKTNSINNAMFARTCMMSRAKYKGSRIEWDIDECDQPLQIVQRVAPRPFSQKGPVTNALTKETRNRFDMLRLDDDDNNESDEDFDTSSEMPSTILDVAA